MIITWLVNSMEPKIGQTFLFLLTIKELSDEVSDLCSDLGNFTSL